MIPMYGPPFDRLHSCPNPNAPTIDSTNRTVADAVVFLRDIDPEKARPWNHSTVTIEQQGGRLHVLQDGVDSRAGFVRAGDEVVLVSKDPYLHALRAAGAAFFTLMFPDPDQPLRRRFERPGRIELSSGVGYYWMRGHLFVDDHPYYERTDGRGRFVLRDVPAGHYQLVCWHPSWLEQGHERDPETCLISRFYFRPPLVQEQKVCVEPGRTTTVSFHLAQALFQPPLP